MEKIGSLSIGKYGFNIGLENYLKDKYSNGNYNLYIDHNNNYTKSKNDYDKLKKSHDELLFRSKPYICTPNDGDTYILMYDRCKFIKCEDRDLCQAIKQAEEL